MLRTTWLWSVVAVAGTVAGCAQCQDCHDHGGPVIGGPYQDAYYQGERAGSGLSTATVEPTPVPEPVPGARPPQREPSPQAPGRSVLRNQGSETR